MSFRHHIDSHNKKMHSLKIQPFVPDQTPVARLREIIERALLIMKTKRTFHQFSEAYKGLSMAELDLNSHLTPAQKIRVQRRLSIARKKFESAKRAFLPHE